MTDAATLMIRRATWLASILLLVLGSLILVFAVGWALVEAWAALQVGAGLQITTYGRGLFGIACVAIVAGLASYAVFDRLERDEAGTIQIDFDRPIVGYHGRAGAGDRWRVEGRISVRARRSLSAIVHDRADDIARAAAEALAVMGPRAVYRLDRTRAERALAELVNRALGSRTVRSIQIRQVRLEPAV